MKYLSKKRFWYLFLKSLRLRIKATFSLDITFTLEEYFCYDVSHSQNRNCISVFPRYQFHLLLKWICHRLYTFRLNHFFINLLIYQVFLCNDYVRVNYKMFCSLWSLFLVVVFFKSFLNKGIPCPRMKAFWKFCNDLDSF